MASSLSSSFFLVLLAAASRASRLLTSERVGVVSAFSPTPTPTSAVGPKAILTTVLVLANIASVAIYLSPIPSFWQMRQTRITAGYDMTPHIVTLLCTLLWGYYGILESDLEDTKVILANNFAGAGFQILYIAAFLYYSARPARILVSTRTVIALVGYTIIVGATYLSHGTRKIVVVECIAATYSVLITFSLLAPTVRAWRGRTVQHMPLPLTCAVALSQFFWIIYGVLAPDMFILYPNAIGCL